MYKTYRDKADFRIVYVREAHPADGWRVKINEALGIAIKEPKTLEDREKIAGICASKLKVSIPMVIDGMDDAVEKGYAGWPVRTYIVGKDGKIAYKDDPGPRGFKPKEAQKALKKLIR